MAYYYYNNGKKYVYGSDGYYHEVIDNGDGPGIVAMIVLMIFAAICYVVQGVYIFLYEHPFFTACISIFGFVTLVGWAKVNYEDQTLYKLKNIGRGFFVLILVLLGFNISIKGFSKKSSALTNVVDEKALVKSIKGQWISIDKTVELMITSSIFESRITKTNDKFSATYTSKFVNPELILDCKGKFYSKDENGKFKAEDFAQNYYCRIHKDTLLITNNQNVNYDIFLRK